MEKMKDTILEKSIEMFLNYGFKSVTMDDISKELGVSKKTIYTHYKTKNELVKACVLATFERISNGIDTICALKKNPIEELFDIKEFVIENLKGEKSSPQYQLEKYYPQLFKVLKKKQFDVMELCIKENLERGIDIGHYRADIDINFISKIYFSGAISIKNIELFPMGKNNMKALMTNYLNYHTRAIATDKGLEKLKEILNNEI